MAVFVALHRRARDAVVQQRRRYADEMKRAEAKAERDRVAAVLNSLTHATNAYDHERRWTYINPASAELLRILGKDPRSLIGRVVWDEVPGLRDSPLHEAALRAESEQRLVEFEEYFPPLDRWFETRVVPDPEDDRAVFLGETQADLAVGVNFIAFPARRVSRVAAVRAR